MEFFLRYDAEGKDTIRKAKDPHLRVYHVGRYAFEGEREEGLKRCRHWDRWLDCRRGNIEDFSAVGMYFALMLRESLQAPIGIIGCNWGGTTASTWMDESILEGDAALSVYTEEYKAASAGVPLGDYLKKDYRYRKYIKCSIDKVSRIVLESGYPLLKKALMKVIQNLPPAPIGPHFENRPGGLYHSMLSKVTGYSCRGVIWYQGESDDVHVPRILFHILYPPFIVERIIFQKIVDGKFYLAASSRIFSSEINCRILRSE